MGRHSIINTYSVFLPLLIVITTITTGCRCRKFDVAQTIELTVGQEAKICKKTQLTFEAVPSDSRCPIGVQCFWEGDAKVRLNLSQKESNHQVELHTSEMYLRDTTINHVHIRLDSLLPTPTAGKEIRSEEYRAFLSVQWIK